MLAFFPSAAAAARSVGEGRLRAGRPAALDSSPLDELCDRFVAVELRIRLVCCDVEPARGRLFPALWYESSIGLEMGGSSLRSSSPGEGSG